MVCSHISLKIADVDNIPKLKNQATIKLVSIRFDPMRLSIHVAVMVAVEMI